MRVMMVCNIPPSVVSDAFNWKRSPFGGWMSSLVEKLLLRDEIQEMFLFFPAQRKREEIRKQIGKLTACSFPSTGRIDQSCKQTKELFRTELQRFRPDIVHLFGTEYSHCLQMIEQACEFGIADRILLHLQGITSEIEKAYMADVPEFVQKGSTLRNLLLQDNLNQEKQRFHESGLNEIRALRSISHVAGRTDFDRMSALQINPDLHYYYCSETLRDSFYDAVWEIGACERNSIFASQCNYPLKGFHKLLEALAIIKKDIPDVRLYTTGNDLLHTRMLRSKLAFTKYQKYLAAMIREKHLENNVSFLGILDEHRMRQRYLQSNVFVCPSAMENSPNSLGEAMLLGVPCVASETGGIPSILRQERDGLLYPYSNADALATGILRILCNDSTAVNFGKSAREHARVLYDRDDILTRTMAIYNAIRDQGEE